MTDGNGNAITANAGKDGNGVETNIDGAGNALYAWVPSFATGRAGRFNIFNESNTSDVITVTTVGNGIAGNFKVDKVTGTSPAVRGEVNSGLPTLAQQEFMEYLPEPEDTQAFSTHPILQETACLDCYCRW